MTLNLLCTSRIARRTLLGGIFGVLITLTSLPQASVAAPSPSAHSPEEAAYPSPTPTPTITPTLAPPPSCSLTATRQGFTAQCLVSVASTGGPVVSTSNDQIPGSAQTVSWNGPGSLTYRAECPTISKSIFTQRVNGPLHTSSCSATVPPVAPPRCTMDIERLSPTSLSCKLTLITDIDGTPIEQYRLDRALEGDAWVEALEWIPGQFGTKYHARGCPKRAQTVSVWGFGPAGVVHCGQKRVPPIPPTCSLQATRKGLTDQCSVTVTSTGGPVVVTRPAGSGANTEVSWTTGVGSLTFDAACSKTAETTFNQVVRGPVPKVTGSCSATVQPVPPDSCARPPTSPYFGNPDCCAGRTIDEVQLNGTSWGKHLDFDGSKAQSTVVNWWSMEEKYKDGKIRWSCARNTMGVKTPLVNNLVYNFGYLGGRNGWGWDDGFNTADHNSCFVCGQVRTVGGCFPPGVRVVLGDGTSTKGVEDVRAGDLLWNPALKRGFKVKTVSQGPEKKDLVVVQAGGRTLRMSSEHPVVTANRFKQAQSLVLGDSLRDESGKEVTVNAITMEPVSAGLTVINFILERSGSEHDGLLIADGLLVGDLTIQRGLAGDVGKR